MRTRALLLGLSIAACGEKVETPDAGPPKLAKKEEPPTILHPECPPIAAPKRRPISENERNESAHVFALELPGDRPWTQSEIFKSTNLNERFRQVRTAVVDGKRRYLFSSTSDEDQCERFYELEEGGAAPHLIATDKEGSVEDPLVFAIAESALYFQLGKDVFKYTIGSKARPAKSSADVLGGAARKQHLSAGIAENQSPDEKLKVSLSGAQITLYDAAGNREVLAKQVAAGGWSIGQSAFSDDSSTLFFDNSGKNACIWEYHFPTKALTKIVPEHEAEHPFFFRKEANESLAYVERDSVRVAVRDTTPRDGPAWRLAPTSTEIDELIGSLEDTKWLRATVENEKAVLEEMCSSEVPSISLTKAKNRGHPEITFGYGQDSTSFRIVYMAERAGDLMVVFEDPDSKENREGYRIQLRKQSPALVSWGHDTRGGAFGREVPHVPSTKVGEVLSRRVEDCEELFGHTQAAFDPVLDNVEAENGLGLGGEILGADLTKEKVAFRVFVEGDGAVECPYEEHPKAGEIWGVFSIEKKKIIDRIVVRPSATKPQECLSARAVEDKRKAARAKLGKLAGKGQISSMKDGSLEVLGQKKRVVLSAKSGRYDGQAKEVNTAVKEGGTPLMGALYDGKARVYVRYVESTADGSVSFLGAVADGAQAAFLEKYQLGGKVAFGVSPVVPLKDL
ncbi:MAG: hypothetical protein HYV07_22845 [Deltaproteobacteria bacterium]|nr:hypothetical protein [Deltaproteobacteria bacterium]